MHLSAWHAWVVASLILFILEIFTPGFILGVLALACIPCALVAALNFSAAVQLVLFAVLAILLALFVRPVVLKYLHRRGPEVRTNVDALSGRAGIVVEALDPMTGKGRVKVGGEDWKAASADGLPIEAGGRVRVLRVEGCTVSVSPLADDPGDDAP